MVHPSSKGQYKGEILSTLDLPQSQIFDGSCLRHPETRDAIRALNADTGLSVYFGYILRPEFISLFDEGIVNLHPGYLPYNKGTYPNVWSILDGTPAGVTLHFIDAGVDASDIIAQQKVTVEPVDTGKTLYHKLEHAALDLFKRTWPRIRAGKVERIPQDPKEGTLHRARELARTDIIHLDQTYSGRDLINILRARTFPPHAGPHFVEGGRKIYLRLELLYEEQLWTNEQHGGGHE